MKLAPILMAALVVAATGAAPVVADPGRNNGKGGFAGHHDHRGHKDKPRTQARHVADCPPGLAKKNPPCVPPGQVGKRYGTRVGDTLRIGNYTLIRNLDRYGLEQRRGWNYYRDDDRIYRVDSGTRKILAVLNLIEAFSN
ncbi:hypothetical protein LOS78_20025 (plasmid) [Paracoccus sp. MA]|uniref:hypothetical protein n=1 Tax=Paracoccus sp. MA TaxID=2895796 RepID=UPI001E34F04B|nr:hypothetical protein [Paracoccus sp. MA]UFM67384.1 hypothetical protein LOS78_20025 [Paracoccus sp. MA]